MGKIMSVQLSDEVLLKNYSKICLNDIKGVAIKTWKFNQNSSPLHFLTLCDQGAHYSETF